MAAERDTCSAYRVCIRPRRYYTQANASTGIHPFTRARRRAVVEEAGLESFREAPRSRSSRPPSLFLPRATASFLLCNGAVVAQHGGLRDRNDTSIAGTAAYSAATAAAAAIDWHSLVLGCYAGCSTR
ncbi:hypothetical protein MRX96_052443 [Rhipicephalus microplus]